MTCHCAETSWFRERGAPIPRLHDCAYVAWRTALVPCALKALGLREVKTMAHSAALLRQVEAYVKSLSVGTLPAPS